MPELFLDFWFASFCEKKAKGKTIYYIQKIKIRNDVTLKIIQTATFKLKKNVYIKRPIEKKNKKLKITKMPDRRTWWKGTNKQKKSKQIGDTFAKKSI